MSTRDDLLELLAEWRKTCSLAGMAHTDADAAAFVAEAYPFNRLDDLLAAEARVAELEAGIRRLADEAKPGLSKMCTCPDCEDDESPIWHDGTPVAWTLDPARLRALVGDETPGTGERA